MNLRQRLRGVRILTVEDDFLQATDICAHLSSEGAVVIGPVSTCKEAMALINSRARMQGAVLDISLGNESTFPVAELLLERSIPFVFATGHSRSMLAGRFEDIPLFGKP